MSWGFSNTKFRKINLFSSSVTKVHEDPRLFTMPKLMLVLVVLLSNIHKFAPNVNSTIKTLHIRSGFNVIAGSQNSVLRLYHTMISDGLQIIYLFFCEGPRSRNYRRTAALRLTVQPCAFPCVGAAVE
jgi:hypothetical protein